jgi:hypothetical protein
MENKHFIRIIDFLNINDNSCDEIIDNIDKLYLYEFDSWD